jgi:hypothetical protein
MTRERRDTLKRETLRQHPELAERYMGLFAVQQARTPAKSSRSAGPKVRAVQRAVPGSPLLMPRSNVVCVSALSP